MVGLGEGEVFLASDIPAILHHTRDIMVVDNGEIVDVTADGARLETIDGRPVHRDLLQITWDAGQAERGGYPHFMLKEIHEQPQAVTETLTGRLLDGGAVALDEVHFPPGFARSLDRIWITACGTALHAGLVGKEMLEGLLRVPVEVAYAHELRYRDPLIAPGSLTVAISQSGETADTLAAAYLAKERGSRLLAVTNVVGSTLSRAADDLLYTRAGPEIAVASTKAYMTMLVGEYLLALALGRERGTLDPAVAAESGGRPAHPAPSGGGGTGPRGRRASPGGGLRRARRRLLHRPGPRLRRGHGGLPQDEGDLLHPLRGHARRGAEARHPGPGDRGHAGGGGAHPDRRCTTRRSPPCRR